MVDRQVYVILDNDIILFVTDVGNTVLDWAWDSSHIACTLGSGKNAVYPKSRMGSVKSNSSIWKGMPIQSEGEWREEGLGLQSSFRTHSRFMQGIERIVM